MKRNRCILFLILVIFLFSTCAYAKNKTTAVLKKSYNSYKKKVSTVKAKAAHAQALDWWKQVQYIFSKGTVAIVTDVKTGRSFRIKRNLGTNHADCEALTKRDTFIIKSIWGGFNWDIRPVVVVVKGKRIAASMSSMAHAGLDNAPAYAVVNNRSGGYSRGVNLDTVKGNGMNGHFDIHFKNSRRHNDNKIDPRHQAAIQRAVGK